MKTFKIKLEKMEAINRFVKIVEKYPYDIDIKSDRYIVDAKSLLGVCSLDTTKPVLLEINSKSCDDLIKELADFILE
jgi:phosphotransferase system HPr-like phosphotransfer protein